METESFAKNLERIFKGSKRTEGAMGLFKITVSLAGVIEDDGEFITFSDKSVARCTDRMDARKIMFKAIEKTAQQAAKE